MVEIPDPDPAEQRVVRQYEMVNARRQFAIPSQHQLLSDAYATLGSELERLRLLETDKTKDDKQKLAVYKLSIHKAEALNKLVKTLQALQNEERIAAAQSVGGKPIDQLSDSEILKMIAQEAGHSSRQGGAGSHATDGSALAFDRERQQPIDAKLLRPTPYKRDRGPATDTAATDAT